MPTCIFSSNNGVVNVSRKRGGNWKAELMTRCRSEHLSNPASSGVNLKLKFSVNRQRATLQKQIFSSILVRDVQHENNGTNL